EAQFPDTQLAGHGDLGGAVHGERDQTVHIGRREPGVGQRVPDRLDREPQFAAAGVLAELGGADPDHRGTSPHHAGPPAIRTVPVTCVPRRLRPTTSTVPGSTIRPLNVSVSYA